MLYHVYGLGNALVDMEYELSDEQLQALQVEKGVMTLVELEQQQAIIKKLGIDKAKKGSGGSAANSLIALAQLGGKACYACRVADDELGQFYLKDLADEAVACRQVGDGQASDMPTGTCLVMVTPDAERTMNTYLGVSSTFSSVDINEDDIKQSEYLYIEGYLVTGENSKAAAVAARKIAEANAVKTAISLSDPNMVSFFKDGLLEMIGEQVDLLFANEDEAMGMAGTDSVETALPYLKSLGKELVITRGAKGAMIVKGDEIVVVDAVETSLVDTNGAGDMFAGTYMYALTQGQSSKAAAQLAAKTAAKLVSQYGARLSKADILEAVA